MKLLSRTGNTKLVKTAKGEPVVLAGLSMMPNREICPASKAADCYDSCLKHAGLAAVYKSVNAARQKKTDWYMADPETFLSQLRRELGNLALYAIKNNKQAVVRLNVISDVAWERHGIPQEFPTIEFYDYTKRADRLGKTPANYKLMFSYSAAPKYAAQVNKALETDTPITVVFRGGLPAEYLGRPVIDGDKSDLDNLKAKGHIVGLRVKGNDAKNSVSPFIVDANIISRG